MLIVYGVIKSSVSQQISPFPWEPVFNRVHLLTGLSVKFVCHQFSSLCFQTSRPLNLVVSHSHSPLGNGSALVSRQPLEFTPERQKQAESPDQQDTPESVEKDETGL